MPTGRLSAAPSSMTRPKLVLRPMRTTRASAMTSNVTAGESDFSMPSCVLDGLGDLIAVAAVDGLF